MNDLTENAIGKLLHRYHQAVPSSLPDLKLKANFGIAAPEMPALVFTHDEEWKEAANGFNVKKMIDFLSQKDVR
ncbi:unnamed protein product [Dibothriocephalus latus]|uniref:Uncharacterized protein n=1 Tax=Dibothriocephalus latus TaxID=60516 RepID=A0A3P6QFF0_DIBLA|nr:unnamed protein product [Dibothriocephalus latus]